MNAMIFAAGLGTRLKPLTNQLPKALAPFQGKPLLWHAIRELEGIGVERIVVNVHHFSEKIIQYVQANTWQSEVLISDESDLLLETGGGLLKAQSLFIPNKPIIIRNVDIVTSTNLESFIYSHRKNKNDATLMVKSRNTSRYLCFNDEMQLCAWKNIKTNEQIEVIKAENKVDLAFSGIHIIEPGLLNEMGEIRPFSIIEAYLKLAKNHQIKGYDVGKDEAWFDVGTIEKLEEAEQYYKSGK
ncbi:nucleotidyltransferase family protein [Carboxylicivirga marina]|uniref:NTP transferase domain-containing protein n=1 Tax=Carboxylicivirga marina TaxID=2800988 RepID=A0ABS1HQ17_9BACT|nr:sugar phosphate nucleotidyltransferase [Carboxylicivirga marina]MBK3519710.1 NTP transferase domain-containing protein [Carboxylicivirga marina]